MRTLDSLEMQSLLENTPCSNSLINIKKQSMLSSFYHYAYLVVNLFLSPPPHVILQ